MPDEDTTPAEEMVPEDSLKIEQLDDVSGGVAEAMIRSEID